MLGPSDFGSTSSSTFNRLLIQLAKEHERQIAALQQEVNDLRQIDGLNSLNGQERLPSASAKDGSVVAVQGGAAPPSSWPPRIQEEQTNGKDSSPPLRGPSTRTDKSSLTESEDAGMTSMHWSLDGCDLPLEFDAHGIAVRISNSRIGKCLGIRKEAVKELVLWWMHLQEPKRKQTLTYSIVESKRFNTLCLLVIFANTLWIMVATDEDIRILVSDPSSWQKKDGNLGARFWIDLSFCSFYSVELLLKMYVHGKFFFLSEDSRWNIFDTVLVVFSAFDVIVTLLLHDGPFEGGPDLTFLRALRLLRMARVMRMVRAVKWIQELRLMLDCMLNSALHLVWCVVLIILVLIIFSLLLVQGATTHLSSLVDDTAEFDVERDLLRGKFDSLPQAMLSLFGATTGGNDWFELYSVIQRCGRFFAVVFLFFISFFTIVCWNIVMSTFVEKCLHLVAPDIDTMAMEKRKKDLHYAKELTSLLEACMDEDGNHVITLDEFKAHMTDAKMRGFFEARDLDMKDAELFFHMLASVQSPDGGQQVDIRTFVLGCMRLRGVASNIDVQSLHYDMKQFFRIEREEIRKLFDILLDPISNAPGEIGITTLPIAPDTSEMSTIRTVDQDSGTRILPLAPDESGKTTFPLVNLEGMASL